MLNSIGFAQKKKSKGEFYFSWGYNKEWYTRSNLKISQAELGNEYELERFQVTLENAFQPLESLRAHLLAELGDRVSARVAYRSAVSLSVEPRVRLWLEQQSSAL